MVVVVTCSGGAAGGEGCGAEDLLGECGAVAGGHDTWRVLVPEIRMAQRLHGRDAAARHKPQHFLQEI